MQNLTPFVPWTTKHLNLQSSSERKKENGDIFFWLHLYCGLDLL